MENFSRIASFHLSWQNLAWNAVVFFCIWRVHSIAKNPSGIHLSYSYPKYIKDLLSAWRFLFQGPNLISEGYRTSNERPYIVQTPGKPYILVSSEAHIKELSDAPESMMSLHAVGKEMFNPRYTMYNFNIHDNSSSNGSTHFRVLQTLLGTKLPSLMSQLQHIFKRSLELEMREGIQLEQGWSSLTTFEVSRRLVTCINTCVFAGPELASNQEYLDAALAYAKEVAVTGEVLNLIPGSLAPFVASLCTKRGRSLKTMLRYLKPLVEERIQLRRDGNDVIQFLVDSTNLKQPDPTTKIIQDFLAMWFASVHELSMSFVHSLHALLEYPSVVASLKEELSTSNSFPESFDSLPLLDSFLKEAARYKAADSISVRRKALQDFTFSDGTVVPKGAWACVPQKAMYADEKFYKNAGTFDVERFLGGKAFRDSSTAWPFWGMGRHTCPGRFYATTALKLMIGSIILGFELKPDDDGAQEQTFIWKSVTVPKDTTMFRIRKGV